MKRYFIVTLLISIITVGCAQNSNSNKFGKIDIVQPLKANVRDHVIIIDSLKCDFDDHGLQKPTYTLKNITLRMIENSVISVNSHEIFLDSINKRLSADENIYKEACIRDVYYFQFRSKKYLFISLASVNALGKEFSFSSVLILENNNNQFSLIAAYKGYYASIYYLFFTNDKMMVTRIAFDSVNFDTGVEYYTIEIGEITENQISPNWKILQDFRLTRRSDGFFFERK